MSFLDKSWKYINEGNLHIVLQLIGTDYVIRLIKDQGNSVDVKHVYNSADFVNFIMLPLLKLDKNSTQEVVKLSESDLSYLNKNLSQFRPENRKFKSVISRYAIKAPNLTLVTTKYATNYCIEIKPKEGFIASSFKKYSKCYYCLKQFLKLQEKVIQNISNYCPLDLFSGDKVRMKCALMNLIDNPQNNFRVFRGGSIVYHSESKRSDFENIVCKMDLFKDSTNAFLDFIIEMILTDNKKLNTVLVETEELSERIARKQCLDENQLLKDGILHCIYSLQKLAEVSKFNDLGDKRNDFDYVSSVINEIKAGNLNLYSDNDKQLFLTNTNPMYLELISAVARDCSIMISFSLDYEEGYQTIQVKDKKIPFKISVTDLEPKSAKTLLKRIKRERKLIDIYEKFLFDSAMKES